MGFDLSSLINQATQFTENQQNNQNGGPKLVYPGPGTLKVKLLYNPKSNLVARQIKRHKVENASATCLGTYGMECPICKSVANIKNATGVDLWKFNAKSRGLSYAQYVGSKDYKWDQGKEPQVGELILLMYPWTVYQDINRLISSAGPQADKLIACNEGKVVNIIRWTENSQIKYKCEVDAFAPDFRSCENDQDFDKFLNELPDLNEAVCPASVTPEVTKVAVDLSESLNRNYLKSGVTGIPTQSGMPGGVSAPIGGANTGVFTAPDGSVFQMVNGQYVMISGPTNVGMQTPPVGGSPMTPNIGGAGGFNPPPMTTPPANPSAPPPAWSPNPSIPTPNTTSPGDTPPWTTGPQGSPTSTPQNHNAQLTSPPPSNNTVVGNVSGGNFPPCMGHHVDSDPKCLSCPFEMQCMVVG